MELKENFLEERRGVFFPFQQNFKALLQTVDMLALLKKKNKKKIIYMCYNGTLKNFAFFSRDFQNYFKAFLPNGLHLAEDQE